VNFFAQVFIKKSSLLYGNPEMSSIYTVTIPTNPYLKAFITCFYGDPVSIDNKSHLGIYLIGVMSKKKPFSNLRQEEKTERYRYFTEKLQCVAPISYMSVYGFSISQDHVILINRYFESLFEEQLYHFVQRNINPNKRYSGYQSAIENFCLYYNIDLNGSVSFECLKKIEWRYRKKVQNPVQKKSFMVLSPLQRITQRLF
jgi:hypothetical protein